VKPTCWSKLYEILALTIAEDEYQAEFALVNELAGVGAGLGGGFTNTSDLKIMKYKEAMRSDKEGWDKAVEEEHNRMIENNVWKVVNKVDVPKRAKILTSTWACKLKSNGTKRARINGRGYEQVDGVHYDSASIHSPVTNYTSVRIIFTLALMAGWIGRISDVKGAFLKGDLNEDKEQMFMHVPEGFSKYYLDNVVLKLIKALYGTKQAAMAFWKELLKCMGSMGYTRNGTDPCMYYKWKAAGLVVWLSWIDDCMVWGPKSEVPNENQEFLKRFECDNVGPVEEYVGCKILKDETEGSITFTQPVMIQSFKGEF
jgi:hypothetical protein